MYYFRVVMQNSYRFDVTVTTTMKDTRYRKIVIPGRQKHTIDIKIDSLDLVHITAKNPSGQPVLLNNAFSQQMSGTVAREAPQKIYIGDGGKIFVYTVLL